MSRVRKGSVGSNPTLPAVDADIRGVTTAELAWAAGVYDGDGSASTYLPKGRKSRVRQMAVYQRGDTMPPPLLFRFRAAVGEVGLIHGASRGSLYQWHSRRHTVVDAVSELLWPWMGEVKRAQAWRAASLVGRRAPIDLSTVWSPEEKAAWAAGFFDAEGTIGVYGDPRRPQVTMEIAQASAGTVPETLDRFQRIVGVGKVAGPQIARSPWSKLPQYRWRLTRFADIERVVAMLYQHADVVKRERMLACLHAVRATRARRRAH
jgi:hypothetical protein